MKKKWEEEEEEEEKKEEKSKIIFLFTPRDESINSNSRLKYFTQ